VPHRPVIGDWRPGSSSHSRLCIPHLETVLFRCAGFNQSVKGPDCVYPGHLCILCLDPGSPRRPPRGPTHPNRAEIQKAKSPKPQPSIPAGCLRNVHVAAVYLHLRISRHGRRVCTAECAVSGPSGPLGFLCACHCPGPSRQHRTRPRAGGVCLAAGAGRPGRTSCTAACQQIYRDINCDGSVPVWPGRQARERRDDPAPISRFCPEL
jgi:hypothetical protein